jgi:type II secretory pathway predicted ATPase ExeA
MEERNSSLASQAFGKQADDGLIVAYQSHQDALRFLATSLGQANAVALLEGPSGSGKTRIVKEQSAWSERNAAVALVDGVHLTPHLLLTGMLSQFDIQYAMQHDDDQLLQTLSRFLTRQTLSGKTPILIIDDADRATPSALRLLNWLVSLEERSIYALRIVLTGKSRLSAMLKSDSMRNFARRHPSTYSLNPLTPQEAVIYLRTRHIAAGGKHTDKAFSLKVCEKLHELSNGWPGELNRCAILAMQRLTEIESAKPIPRIIVSRDGEYVATFKLTERQHLIGRNELADIMIEDAYVSKIHAMLQVYANAVVLIDLNSTNGTTVNSRIVEKTILRNDDIIALGRYRLKIENAPAMDREMDERIKTSDTLTMLNLEDMRRARARRTIKVLKHK